MAQLIITIPDSVDLDLDTTSLYRAFLQGMTNRRVVGAIRYGDKPKVQQKYLSRLKKELKAYEQNGNFEQLLNIANYAFLEGAAPQNPKLHFDPNAESVTRAEFGGEVKQRWIGRKL